MANRYCNLTPSKKISEDFQNITTGFDKVQQEMDAKTATDNSLQQQITSHVQSTTAHPAQNISYSGSVSGQSNVKGALDNLQAQVNGIVATPNDGNAEITQARQGLDGTAHPTLKSRLDKMEGRQIDAARQSATLKHGPNLIQTDQASPLAATVYGRTLVNLLGKDGGCESLAPFTPSGTGTSELSTTQKRSGATSIKFTTNGNFRYLYKDYNYALDPAKQYVVAVWVYIESQSSGGAHISLRDIGTFTVRYGWEITAPIGAWKLLYFKVPTSNTLTGNGFRLLFGVTGSTSTITLYMDEIRIYELSSTDYAAIGTTYTTDDQIDAFIPYVDSVQHLQGSAIHKAGKNQLPPGTEAYSINAAWSISEPYKATLVRSATGQYLTFRVPCLPNQQYTLSYSGASSGILRIVNAYNSSGAMTNLASNAAVGVTTVTTPADAVTLEVQFSAGTNGTYELSNWQLELGSIATPFEPRNDDYVYIPTKLASSVDGSVRDSFDTRTGQVARRWKTDVALDGSLNWTFGSVGTGTKYLYVDWSMLPAPPVAHTQTVVKYDGKILKRQYAPFDANIGDSTWLYTPNFGVVVSSADSGWGDSYTPSAAEIKAYFYGWRMNNGTFGQPYNGSGTKTWVPWNATDNSGAVTTVPTTPSSAITSGAFDYYRLSYQLATPVTEPVEGYEGSIGLHAGGNVVELLEGVVVREKATPRLNGTVYEINQSSFVNDRLKYRADTILQVYRGQEVDKKWGLRRSTDPASTYWYGRAGAQISPADYDPNAEYFVTYIALDRYKLTANAVEAKVEYNTNQKTVIDALVQDMADTKTAVSVNVRAIAELYKRVKALGG